MKKLSITSISLIFLLMTSMVVITVPAQNSNSNPETQGVTPKGSIIWENIGGMTGEITTEMELVDQTNGGHPDTVLVGTNGGAMAIDLLSGEIYTRYTTLDPVLSIADLADIDGLGRNDFVITTHDQQTPNVIAVSTETGGTLWKFKPMVQAFTETDGLIDMETISWCVDSISAGSGKDVVVSSWRMVHRLSGDDGDVLWTFKGGNDIWTVVVSEDLTGDGESDVLAGTQDGDIHLLNGETGSEVWGHDLTQRYEKVIVLNSKGESGGGEVNIAIDLSLWSILTIEDVDRDGVPDVFVSSEDGFITLISGDGGDILWSKKIVLQNEPTIDEEELVGVQSGIDSPLNFFNPRLTTIDDFDGDGLRDILVMGITRSYEGTAKIISSSTGGPMTRQGKGDRDSGGKSASQDDEELVDLDDESILFTTSGTDALDIPVIWSTEAIVNPNGTGNYSLLLPHRNKIKLIDTVTKNTTTYFDHPILENAWLGRFQLKFFDNPDDSHQQLMIMTIGISGVMVVDPQTQEVLWDVNNMESVEVLDISDITGDGTGDLMVLSSLGASSQVRSIYTIDRVTGEELWRHSVSLSEIATMGARGIIVEHDLTGDGNVDVLAYRQSDEGGKLLERGNHSFVFVLEGTSGNMVWERQVTNQLFYNSSLNASEGVYEDFNAVNRRIASLDLSSDLSGDNIPDVIVGGEAGTIYLLDGSNGMQLWNMTNNDIGWLPWYPQVDFVDDDPTNGLLITDLSSNIFFSNIWANGSLSANYSWRYPQNLSSPDNDEILPGSIRLIEDLDGDGRSDVVYFSIEEQVGDDEGAQDTYACHVLSGLNGHALGPGFSIGAGSPFSTFAPGVYTESEGFFIQDLNGNGVKDAVIFKTAEGKRAPPQIIAIDGGTHQEIWVNDEIFAFAFSGGNPLRIIDDSNGDGTPDILVGSGRWGTQGADIHILDGATGDRLDLIEYEEQTEFSDWNMAQPVDWISTIGDVSGDGVEEMLVQRVAQVNDEEAIVLEIVDIQAGELIRQVPVGYAVAKDNGDINSDGKSDILVSQGNSMYCLDGSYSLSILSPVVDDDVEDEFVLKWNLDSVDCEVFVDGISFGTFSDGDASLTLSGGEHEIIVETTDEFGGLLSDTITVNVPESNAPLIIEIIVVVIFIIALVAIFMMKRTKLKKREEYWRKKRREIEASKDGDGKKSNKLGRNKKIKSPPGGKAKKQKRSNARFKSGEVAK